MTRRTTFAIALAATATLVGCDDPLSPKDIEGRFVLVSVPADLVAGGGSYRVLADTFFIEPDGFGARRAWLERTQLVGGAVDTIVDGAYFSSRIEGDSIGFQWLCPPDVICAAVGHRDWYDLGLGGRSMRSRGEFPLAYLHIGPAPHLLR